jgi:hypothetical protein
VAYGSNDSGDQKFSAAEKKNWYRSFLWHAERHGHKSGWAFFKFQEKFHEKPPWAWRVLGPVEPDDSVSRWIRSRNIAYARAKEKAGGAAACPGP